MPETLESQPNGAARSTCDPPIRESFEPLLTMELEIRTGCYSDARRSLDSNDIRSYSVKAYMVKNPSPLMICLLLLSVLGIVLSVMTAISICPKSQRRLLTG
ncbi:hypothetical protein BDV36DRAFT_247081 [Aspergillus pseudocaelatus]|uniref:Uncharacterized protein n=1 Tax=Aspergillus pseudocaelatus TaxID=1825620 RepID=A0ABQ6WZ87_9EURO|nr:hypothetical protein BDV36DRAFT_247081 [Aspergillus pseudocaelatus]